MRAKMVCLAKLFLTGLITTMVRIAGQLSLPAGEQTVLAPSVFAQNGTMPLVFTIYGFFAYTGIAALFLLIRRRMGGSRLSQGLKYGLSCCAVWVVYLWEPLPHVAPLDRITYPLADGLALIAMGLCLGWLLGIPGQKASQPRGSIPWIPALAIAGCFLAGRLFQYCLIGIYSSFDAKIVETLLWCLITGLATGGTMAWLNRYVGANGRLRRALALGGLLFGVDLALFNFFMLLVFTADIPDLIARTLIDVCCVTIGCLSFPAPESILA